MKSADTHGLVWRLSGKQTRGQNTAGLRCHGRLTLQCTRWLHSAPAAASLSCNVLLSTDRRPSQWWLCNHILPCQLPVDDAQPRVSDTDDAPAWLIVCMFLSDYHKSNRNSEYWKTEFELEFENQTSYFRNFFNNPILKVRGLWVLSNFIIIIWSDWPETLKQLRMCRTL